MSQGKVLEVLKNNSDRWLDSKELSVLVGSNRGNVIRNLRVLREQGFVHYKRVYAHMINPPYLYKHKK